MSGTEVFSWSGGGARCLRPRNSQECVVEGKVNGWRILRVKRNLPIPSSRHPCKEKSMSKGGVPRRHAGLEWEAQARSISAKKEQRGREKGDDKVRGMRRKTERGLRGKRGSERRFLSLLYRTRNLKRANKEGRVKRVGGRKTATSTGKHRAGKRGLKRKEKGVCALRTGTG